MEAYTYVVNLLDSEQELPTDSILSRTLIHNDDLRVILFQFAQGQELSEHTSAKPAMLQFLTGTATITLGNDKKQAGPNTYVYMQPNLPHSIVAETPVTMLLTMLEKGN